jgi:hypothetical protein
MRLMADVNEEGNEKRTQTVNGKAEWKTSL